MLKNLIITGGTGMIGRLLLEKCLSREDVKRVTAINHKSLGIYHPKLVVLIHNNFHDYSAIEQQLKDQHVCFYCIGVYPEQIPANEYKKK